MSDNEEKKVEETLDNMEAGESKAEEKADEPIVAEEPVPKEETKDEKQIDEGILDKHDEEEGLLADDDTLEEGQMLDLNDELENKEKENSEKLEWIKIANLSRPYSLPALKRHLSEICGEIAEDGFWINSVKSVCCVKFVNHAENAQKLVTEMDGKPWPEANPKNLSVSQISNSQRNFCEKHEDSSAPPSPKKVLGKDGGPPALLRDFASRRKSRTPPRRRRRSNSPSSTISREPSPKRQFTIEELEKNFRKTKAEPALFWKPLSEEQALEKNPPKEVKVES